MTRPSRQRGFGVAVLGPDGVGKTTLIAGLKRASLPLPIHSVYMGFPRRASPGARAARLPGVALPLTWIRLGIAKAYRLRGSIVLFDRYPYDLVVAADESLPWYRRAHRRLLAGSCPLPDLVVVLDAPSEVIASRKREYEPAVLERHRRAYLALAATLANSVVVDASGKLDDVLDRLAAELRRHLEPRLRVQR